MNCQQQDNKKSIQHKHQKVNQRKAHMSRIRSSIQAIPLRRQTNLLLEQKSVISDVSSDETNETLRQSPVEQERKNLGDYSAFEEKYELFQKLGEGTNGVVYKCLKKSTGIEYAVKSFSIEEENLPALKSNFLVMKNLNHPNIVKYEALYVDTRRRMAWLVMELVNASSLDQVIFKDQEDIKNVMFHLMEALEYLHERDIVHRDIKPENILYIPETKTIKLIDFGISKRFRRRGTLIDMWTITGTLYYRAPEMFCGGYREPVDVWAAGVLLYQMVTGRTPFQNEYHNQTIQNIRNGQYSWPSHFEKYSNELKILVGKMLKKQPEERLTASSCLTDRWFTSLKKNESKNDFSMSDKDIVLQMNSQGYCRRKSKKNKQDTRKQSLDASLLGEYFFNQEKSHSSEITCLTLPAVKKINGKQYYCIEPEWKSSA